MPISKGQKTHSLELLVQGIANINLNEQSEFEKRIKMSQVEAAVQSLARQIRQLQEQIASVKLEVTRHQRSNNMKK